MNCSKCEKYFEVKRAASLKRTTCIQCYKKEWSSKPENLEKKRAWSEKINKTEKGKIYRREYYLKNREKALERSKKQRETANKEKRRAYYREYARQYWHQNKNNENIKLRAYLRSRLRLAVKKGQKRGSAIKDLGCSIEQLQSYIESKFKPGMTWKNWGRGASCWHIDHICPLSKFDLTDREEYCKAVHYTNLQPLWEKENLRKYNNG